MQASITETLIALATAAQEHGAPAAHAPAGEMAHGARYTLLVPLFTLLGAALCGLFAAMRVRSRLPAWISVGLLAASFVAIVAAYLELGATGQRIAFGFRWIDVAWGEEPGRHLVADFAFYIDSLTLLWMLFVTGLGALIALYASEYMAGDLGVGYCRFFAAFNLFVFSMSCLVMADNLVLLYLGWEGVGLCSYLLIGYFYKKPSAVAAAKKAFIVNRIGDLGLALGIMLAFVQFGSVRYQDLFNHPELQQFLALAREGRWEEIPAYVQAIPLLLLVGAIGKSAQFPLYVWLPDAMEGPTPVSALIHAATMVTAGVYLVARSLPLFLASEHALAVVAWVGTGTAFLAATIGMAQFDIKRIMAYSTVSQLGFMFAGLGFLTSVGAASHVFTHAFFKALLFLACGAVMHGFAGQLDLRRLSGVQKLPGWKLTGVTMLVGCLNLAGFPLITSGFWSKDMIMAEGFVTQGPGFRFLGFVLLATAGLTAYYTFRVYFRVFLGPVHFEPGEEHGHHDEAGHGHEASGVPTPRAKAEETGEERRLAERSGAAGHHEDGHFHPHAPGPAINLVLGVLAVLTFAAIPLVLLPKEHHGWVGLLVHHSSAAVPAAGHGAEHAGFFSDPHSWMLLASSAVGIVGITLAWWLHLAGRTTAAHARADALMHALGPIPRWAQNKWYVDELYDFLFVRPLWVVAHVFHLIDKLLVDGLVNGFGWLPRLLGGTLRPSQSGALHGYALGMAGGIAVVLLIVVLVTA